MLHRSLFAAVSLALVLALLALSTPVDAHRLQPIHRAGERARHRGCDVQAHGAGPDDRLMIDGRLPSRAHHARSRASGSQSDPFAEGRRARPPA